MPPNNTIKLETERLQLRPFSQADLDDLTALNGDKEVMKYISPPLSREQVSGAIDWFAAEWERLGYGWFALFEKETGSFVGQCGLQCLEGNPEAKAIEIAFVISQRYWGLGYATEACRAVLAFGFKEANLEQIVAVAMKENALSRRVLEKLGFRYIEDRLLYERTVMYFVLNPREYIA